MWKYLLCRLWLFGENSMHNNYCKKNNTARGLIMAWKQHVDYDNYKKIPCGIIKIGLNFSGIFKCGLNFNGIFI